MAQFFKKDWPLLFEQVLFQMAFTWFRKITVQVFEKKYEIVIYFGKGTGRLLNDPHDTFLH